MGARGESKLGLGPCGGTPDSRLDAPLALGDGAEKLAHKSPTEVARGLGAACPCKLRRAILEFASSRRAEPLLPQLIPQPCASRDGRQHGEQDQGARARPALGACATRPGHAVNMLAEERLCKRHPGAASMQLHGCARHCRQLCQSLTEHSNLACRLRPATAQSPGGGRTCVSSYGVSWGLGKLKFVRLA